MTAHLDVKSLFIRKSISCFIVGMFCPLTPSLSAVYFLYSPACAQVYFHACTHKDIHGLIFNMTTIYHESLSLSFGDPVAGSRATVSSLTYKTTTLCVCMCLYKVHDASVSIWQRAEQEAARWGSACAVLSSSPPPFTRSGFRLAFDSWREGHPGF